MVQAWNVANTAINFEKDNLGCLAIGAGANRVNHYDLGHIRCSMTFVY